MLAHLRTAGPRLTPSPWAVSTCSVSRSRSVATAPSFSKENEDEDNDDGHKKKGRRSGPRDPPFDQWLDTTGRVFKDPVRPRNWLGGKVPFPLNPSFKPPTPVSDKLRTLVYNEYMTNPELYNVRVLSERHGLSIQRVDAILRLKGMEDSWKKNKPLQTGFRAGMEEILGVTDNTRTLRQPTGQGKQELGDDATEADASSSTKDRLRDRYQRLFWEPIVEGQEPVLLRELERARLEDRSRARAMMELRDRQAHVPAPKEQVHAVVERPGHTTIKFIDVGGKFVDLDDRLARLKAAKHRSQVRQKRRVRPSQAVKNREAAVATH